MTVAGEASSDTRVSVRRVFQLCFDVFVASLVLSLLWWLITWLLPAGRFRYEGEATMVQLPHLVADAGGWYSVVAVLAAPLALFLVFVLVPVRTGRTPMMALFGLRIRRADGGPVSGAQHLVRALLLVLDTAFGGLLGLVVMLCSRRRQRIGDHLAGTVVVRAASG
ncbi:MULTISPECIES: RDD family protein [unclassified Pseudonocardia]|uniref:RDD family protein n=1 Tax=unclassified Pseudonocardia TaxID=2619320 RepID=UPI001CF6BB08|nr:MULTISPECIES: RDD family protein [unclassified Pseudonocardia]